MVNCAQGTTQSNELTLRAIFFGVLMAILMGIATTYLGLKAGRTASMGIHLAVLSTVVLRKFKGSTVLENNIMQTVASAGNSLASGALFTIPALLISGYWSSFSYLEVLLILVSGCILGVALTIPLRRLLIVNMGLLYPGGMTTALLIKDGVSSPGSINALRAGSIIGAISVILSDTGLIMDKVGFWFVRRGIIVGGEISLDLAMFAIGFISGGGVARAMVIGILLRMFFIFFYDYACIGPEINSVEFIRMISIGIMATGGFVGIFSTIKSMFVGFIKPMVASGHAKHGRDLSLFWVSLLVLLSMSILAVLFKMFLGETYAAISGVYGIWSMAVLAFVCILIVFVCTIVGSRVASESLLLPISGITVLGIMLFSAFLTLWHGMIPAHSMDIVGVVILHSAIVAVATVIGADNMQDLKAGFILGATPWKQQVALVIGGLTTAFIIEPVLEVLHSTYGITGATVGAVHGKELAAPQANLIATISKAMFIGGNSVQYVGIGIAIALAILLYNAVRRDRLQPLTVSLGIYFPLESSLAMVCGGLFRYVSCGNMPEEDLKKPIMFCSGAIASVATAAVIIAVIASVAGDKNFFAIGIKLPDNAWVNALRLMGSVAVLGISGSYVWRTVRK